MSRILRETQDPIGSVQMALLLHSVPHLGEKALARLLRTGVLMRSSPDELLALTEKEWVQQFELESRAANYISMHRENLKALSAETARMLRLNGIHLLTCNSFTYPEKLEKYDDAPPPLLYALGNLELLEHKTGHFTFTTVLSNGSSSNSLTLQDRIASSLISAGGMPVTGHDRKAYQRLALCAQRVNRPAIYMLDRGLREALGPQFDLPLFAAARIREIAFNVERDIALSPFRLDDHCLGGNNRRRDRLIFAQADLIIAVEVRADGSMYNECMRVREQGRPLLVIDSGEPGNSSLLEAGCTKLISDSDDWAETVRLAALHGEVKDG